MKIKETVTPTESKVIKVTNAHYLGEFQIRIEFNDATCQTVDFKPFLSNSHHPEIRKYLNEELFAKYKIKDGNLNWGDFDLIFPVWDLYQGAIN